MRTPGDCWRRAASCRTTASGALDAWNHVGEPRVDLIRVDGLVRTRQRIVEDLLPVERNDVLTPQRFVRARRQLRELPSAASAELTFVPVPSGLVELHATVAERSLVPADRWSLASLGVVAAFRREVEVSSGAFTGGGERLTIGWRYWPGTSAGERGDAAPAPWGGLWGVDAFTERQPFTDDALPTSRRRGAHLSMSDWVAPWARASMRGGVERWDGVDTFGMIGTGLRVLTIGERLDGRVDVSGWKARIVIRHDGRRRVTIRSTTERRGQVFVARGGVASRLSVTPADIWFAGDTGRARPCAAARASA